MDKAEREREFHNKVYSEDVRQPAWRFYQAALLANQTYEEAVLSLPAKQTLEFGCGRNSLAARLASKGREATGIDISDKAVELSRKEESGAKFIREDAENMSFEDDSFDLVYGRSIIHHLDLDKAFLEIDRVLRPLGQALFLEPLGHNPLINLYRKRTPDFRSEDEHPLLRRDIKKAGRLFSVSLQFFTLSSLAGPLLSKPSLIAPLEKFDRVLFKTPLRWQSWMVLISLNKRPRG